MWLGNTAYRPEAVLPAHLSHQLQHHLLGHYLMFLGLTSVMPQDPKTFQLVLLLSFNKTKKTCSRRCDWMTIYTCLCSLLLRLDQLQRSLGAA